MQKETLKKITSIASNVLTWLLVIFTVFMVVFTIFTVTTFDRTERDVFGYKFFIVQTDSMSKSDKNAHMDVHFNAGDIIVVKELSDNTKFGEGDIISFMSSNPDSFGETITHMIKEVKYKDGKVEGYVTYGTNTGTPDEKIVVPDFVLGVYVTKLPTIGRFFAFVKTTPGYIVCILVPFLLLILYNGVNVVRLFKRYKGEQTEAINAERRQIEQEREENKRMMEELLALKAQLSQQSTPAAPSEAEQVSAEAEAPSGTDEAK